MNFLMNLNNFLYHSAEVILCDVKLFILKAKVANTDRRIQALEARLSAQRA